MRKIQSPYILCAFWNILKKISRKNIFSLFSVYVGREANIMWSICLLFPIHKVAASSSSNLCTGPFHCPLLLLRRERDKIESLPSGRSVLFEVFVRNNDETRLATLDRNPRCLSQWYFGVSLCGVTLCTKWKN